MAKKDFKNPFYVILLVAGALFAVTASAYGVMAFRTFHMEGGAADAEPSGLMRFLDQHGGTVMAWQLAVLAVATVGAIGTDQYWQKRA